MSPTAPPARRRRPSLALAIALAMPFCGAAPARAEMTALEAQRALGGTWVGDGTTLVVDTQRLQVNIDPDKPFDWRSFTLVNVSGKMVVFRVGAMPYIALFATRTAMTLTSPSFTGERSLRQTRR